eukprot:gene9439-12719_t
MSRVIFHDKNVESLMNHLGIDCHEDPEIIINELMAFTLHCLGAIRKMVIEKENSLNQKTANAFNPHMTEIVSIKKKMKSLRSSFSFAVNHMLSSIIPAAELSDINPVRHLVESFPDANRIGSSKWCALQWALVGDIVSNEESETQRMQSFIDLADSYSDLKHEVDKEGRTIVHYTARMNSLALAREVVSRSYDSSKMKITDAESLVTKINFNGALPLHNAARFSRTPIVLNYFADLIPETILVGNNEGILPLHWAAAKNTCIEIVQSLIKANPSVLHTPTHDGYLPLHCAGQNKCLEVVEAVYAAHPDAIYCLDMDGAYPLHHACYFNRNLDVIRFFHKAYPDALSIAQHDGVTPIHLCATQNDSSDVLRFILKSTTNAAFVADNEGWLALHCILETSPFNMTAGKMDCLRILIKANPTAKRIHKVFHLDSNASNNTEHEIMTEGVTEIHDVITDGASTAPTVTSRGQSERLIPSPYSKAKEKGHSELVLRLLLNANPTEDILAYCQLNWQARKLSIICAIHSHHSQLMENSKSDDKKDYRHVAFDKLCLQFMSNGKIIPNGLIRQVIKFI